MLNEKFLRYGPHRIRAKKNEVSKMHKTNIRPELINVFPTPKEIDTKVSKSPKKNKRNKN